MEYKIGKQDHGSIVNLHNKTLGIDTRASQFFKNILSLFKQFVSHCQYTYTYISGQY